MLRALLAIFCGLMILSACTQRMICPAYQSAYIYDKDQLRKKFSYFQEDSTPKIYTASKTKYLIAEPTSYRKKMRSMSTVAMKPVKTILPDSLAIKENEGEGLLGEESADGSNAEVAIGSDLDRAARSVEDSTYIVDTPVDTVASAEDSVYVISKDKETRVLKYNFPDSLHYDTLTGKYIPEVPKYEIVHVTFNVDQDNYMWYLKDYLVLPDVRLAKMQQKNKQEGGEEGKETGKKAKKAGLFGFFKNLFGKKDQAPTEEEAPPPPKDEDEFDFIDENQVTPATPENNATPAKEKKAKKKKKEKEKEKEPEEQTPEQKEEAPKEDEQKPEPPKKDDDSF